MDDETERSGVRVATRLRCFRPLLREWLTLHARLGREWQSVGDAPWWYNERALLSVLAGAVWRTGGSALEEYSEQKRRDGALAPGRVDLWLSCGPHSFWAEAKAMDIPFTRSGSQMSRVARCMAEAKADIRRCAPDGSTRRLAIVFGRPYLRPGPRAERERRIEWLVEQAPEVEHDALAWVFTDQRRLPTNDDWVCPGAMIWIKEVRR